MVEIDQEFKDLLDETRTALLAKIDKPNEVLEGAGDWFDETGSLGVETKSRAPSAISRNKFSTSISTS